MLKRTLAWALFAVAGHAYSADILVTTLVDEDKDDAVCSLREAVEFLNKRSQKEFENGYHGCGNKDSTSTIILQRDKEYLLNKAIYIKSEMTIKSAASGDFNDNKKGLNNATIKAIGSENLFVIYDDNVEKDLLKINFSELNLQGTSKKILEGGLILNRERLSIDYSRLSGGYAVFGGAIYNKGVLADKTTAGIVSISSSIVEKNEADQGAAIYSDMPLYYIVNSVIRNNIVKMNGGILYSNQSFNDETIGNVLDYGISGVRNSTIYNNRGGYVANIREGAIINNITAIYNEAGFYLQAPKWKFKTVNGDETTEVEKDSAYVANSIIAKNGSNDFLIGDKNATVVQSNLINFKCNDGTENCLNAAKGLSNIQLGSNQLLAGGIVEQDSCDFPQDKGLLCPYRTPKDQMLGFFLPRILTDQSLSQSLIINKGRIYSDGSSLGLVSCESTDQRGKSRTGYIELCDLGAIELVVNLSDIQIAGQDILYGQVAEFSIANSLLDGELLDPKYCEGVTGKKTDSKGQSWQAGCLEIEQTETISKGVLRIDQDGNIIYRPNSNWHGADKFNIRVITTVTATNDITNRYIDIPTTIVQDPPNTFTSKTVNVSGGSLGLSTIFILFGLLGFRRFKS